MLTRYLKLAAIVGAVLALAVILVRPPVLSAEAPKAGERTLDVVGRGTVTAKYDTATITLGVTHLAPGPVDAYNGMGDNLFKVVYALKDQGVKDEDLKTGVLSLNAEYDWSKDGGQVLKGYRATSNLTITTQKLDKVPNLIQAAVSAGSNQLQGVSFSIKNTDALIEKAMDAAVDDARAKAERVASRLGTTVTGVYKVSIIDQGVPNMPILYGAGKMEAAARDAAPVFTGSGSDVTVQISVTFELK